MKKFLAFVMAASMALSLAACGGSSASTATSTTTEATSEAAASTSGSKTDVAFVTDVGNIDDQSFNQYTWQGVQDFCSANSLNANYYRPTEAPTPPVWSRWTTLSTTVLSHRRRWLPVRQCHRRGSGEVP